MSLFEWLFFSVWTCLGTHTEMFQHFESSVCVCECLLFFLCFKTSFECKTSRRFQPKQENNHWRYCSLFKTSMDVLYNETTDFTALNVVSGGGSPLLTQCVSSPSPLPTKPPPLPRIVYSHSEYYFVMFVLLRKHCRWGSELFYYDIHNFRTPGPPSIW